MATTKQDLRAWFDRAVREGTDFMLVICDTFDYEDYPVGCTRDNFTAVYRKYKTADMQRVMEVYDLSIDREQQMAERRAFHLPSTQEETL